MPHVGDSNLMGVAEKRPFQMTLLRPLLFTANGVFEPLEVTLDRSRSFPGTAVFWAISSSAWG